MNMGMTNQKMKDVMPKQAEGTNLELREPGVNDTTQEQSNIFVWKDFEVQGYATILGFYVGPQMGAHNWVEPLSKFRDRIKDIKQAGASISLNAFDYNAKVVPVTSYVAQLLPLSTAFFLLERAALHAVARAPFNTFRHADFSSYPQLVDPNCVPSTWLVLQPFSAPLLAQSQGGQSGFGK